MNAPAPKLGYAPRNALNAADLKARIDSRSRARGDNEEIRAWLLNHFFRHVVANFIPAWPIESLEDAQKALAPEPLPAWVVARFERKGETKEEKTAPAPVVWVDPTDPQLLALEARLVEFLESRAGTSLVGKLHRINCPQALTLWEKEHARIAARIERGWRESRPDALRTLLTTSSGRFVEFLHDSALLRTEMAYESYAMRHCLGQFTDPRTLTGGYGQRYAEAIEQLRVRLISFRDINEQPHVTISMLARPDGSFEVEQVKGKQNRPPVDRYVDEVVACLNAIGTNDVMPADCIAIGVVRTEAGWTRIENVEDEATQARLVVRYPRLFERVTAPPPMLEWLMAARQPQSFRERTPRASAVRYAVRTRDAQRENESKATFVTDDVEWPGFDASELDTTNASPSAT
ncbi:hypothetical protein [Trinickia dinghuensis]|uniref:Uncharacterized protein n=1 Tax=Trinickia dinghuensis TaxID=2291023 RepID=A0A3D8K1J2_9BURK|nr:hypothetical protein [Trinickia dinghuensis]RDU98990.1 hypothetical protein DWV00_12185 [Trinickia dinghuensis]